MSIAQALAETFFVDALDILHECSRLLLARHTDVHLALQGVLELLAARAGLRHGTITLLRPDSRDLVIAAAHGLSPEELARGHYKLGEGITGRVAQAKRSAVVPDIASEPQFLDRTRARRTPGRLGVSFLCVPILHDDNLLGTLSVDRPLDDRMSLDDNLRLIEVIASMLATTVERIRASAAEMQVLEQENRRLQLELETRFDVRNLLGQSHPMQQVKRLIAQVAPSQATVLIRGESGTGKELVAQGIHYNSNRRDGPFIRVNCAALPETLIESELFGHEKGAFTGATERHLGRFELARGGTMFLDEIGDISPAVQVRLLRVLQEREFERVGGTATVTADVRVITATSRDLEALMAEKRLREDLYYRLNVFPIFLPPLRDRGSDLVLLADHFLEKYSDQHGNQVRRITEHALALLLRHRWPGNVRELENAIERAVILSSDGAIHSSHLPPSMQTQAAIAGPPAAATDGLKGCVARFAGELMRETIQECQGNAAAAARRLNTTPRILRYRLRQIGLDPLSFRPATRHRP
ncbi:MAG: sigma 54-interacting transcriptional regulator [bacterium]